MKFVAIDFETTGLTARNNRVIEIGLVRFTESFDVESEFCSLVNPGRDVGRTDIHGITPTMLDGAPTFSDIAHQICEFINGSRLVAHNKRFDLDFLGTELMRAGIEPPELDAVCTIELIRSAYPSSPRRLHDACQFLGIEPENAHEALADARMAARIAMTILRDNGFPALPSEVILPVTLGVAQAPLKTRQSHQDDRPRSYLAELVSRLPETNLIAGREAIAANEYLNLLDRVIEDRIIDNDEADLLSLLAGNLGLSAASVRMLHSSYLYALCKSARADGDVSESERRDIQLVADALGLESWEELLASDLNEGQEAQQFERSMPVGTKVCFTGQMDLSRPECEETAIRKGLVVWPRITKEVEVLVVADPKTQSTKAQKARQYGARIMSERAFFREIANYPDVDIDESKDAPVGEPDSPGLVIEIGGQVFSEFGFDFGANADPEAKRWNDMESDLNEMLALVEPVHLAADEVKERLNRLGEIADRLMQASISIRKACEDARGLLLDVWSHARSIAETWKQPTQSMFSNFERIRGSVVGFLAESQAIIEFGDFRSAHRDLSERMRLTQEWIADSEPRIHHSQLHNRESKLRAAGIIPNQSLQGMSIVITGEFSEFETEEGRRAILDRGGKSPWDVSGRTYVLVAGENARLAQFEDAFTKGTPVIGYAEFLTILDEGSLPNVPKRERPPKPENKAKSRKNVEVATQPPEPPVALEAAQGSRSDREVQRAEDSATLHCQRCGIAFPSPWAVDAELPKCPDCRGTAGR
jgi:DNA polymerase-3 subunit epsilon